MRLSLRQEGHTSLHLRQLCSCPKFWVCRRLRQLCGCPRTGRRDVCDKWLPWGNSNPFLGKWTVILPKKVANYFHILELENPLLPQLKYHLRTKKDERSYMQDPLLIGHISQRICYYKWQKVSPLSTYKESWGPLISVRGLPGNKYTWLNMIGNTTSC